MDCNETRRLLDADLDGELDLVRHLELAAHLRACPACAALAESAQARRLALRERLPRFAAPAALAEKIRAGVERVAPNALSAPPPPMSRQENVSVKPRGARALFPLWPLTGLAASLAVAVLFGYAWGTTRARASLLLDEAVADHVRSLQAGHLTDVASTDQHTVKPWFAGKLEFSPPVVDLAAEGFPLVGGRLEQLDRQPAAALVFKRREHAINLFVWPARSAPRPAATTSREGFHAEAWAQGDLNFLAVSDVAPGELEKFADAFRRATR